MTRPLQENVLLTDPTIKGLTVRLEEASKQVPLSVTDVIEKAAWASTWKKQQPFVLGLERIDGKQSTYTWINWYTHCQLYHPLNPVVKMNSDFHC